MEFVILTGLSGAGKTNALHSMEDMGFYCVDNLPPILLETFYDLCDNSADNRMKQVAVVADARSGGMVEQLDDVIAKLRAEGKSFRVAFFDARPEVLLARFKETRRKHPLLGEVTSGTVEDAVELEAELMRGVKAMSDYVIDTTLLKPDELKERVATLFAAGALDSLLMTFISFGYKYTIPLEADVVIDVRCLPNPFYVKELKPMNGLDEAVQEYLLGFDVTHELMEKVTAYIDFIVDLYKKQGKSQLVIGVGCTGGRHRSVALARMLNVYYLDQGQKSAIHHRDIWKA